MIKDFISLIFPSCCYACYQPLVRGEEMICIKCIVDLPKTNLHLQKHGPIVNKVANLKKLKHAIAYLKFVKCGRVQRLMHKIKYQDLYEVSELLGIWYGKDLRSIGMDKDIDIILPVPLHKSKLKSRGYNQSSYFASGLSQSLERPWSDDTVSRVVKSTTQTKKSKVERWENVSGIFKVEKPELVKDMHVLLVDDVMTTGSTIEACGMELENYCSAISVATIALA
jgi:ComF family protein